LSSLNQPALSVVIVSYNCLGPLRDCLASFPAADYSPDFEIIVVDNNSEDGTPELVPKDYPEVRLVCNSTNRGFAAGCNQGILVSEGKYVLLLNPDTVVRERALRLTYEYMEHNPRVAAASCRVLRPDGSLDPSCKRDFPTPWNAVCRVAGLSRLFPRSRVFARYDTGYLNENTTQEVPLIDGCYMMIRRAAIDDIGLFDEQFFMYWEETDWCRRAHQRGWSIGYDPSGTIIHTKGETTRHYTFRMLYHFHRSFALYYRKHLGLWNPLFLMTYPLIWIRLAALCGWNLMRRDRRVSG